MSLARRSFDRGIQSRAFYRLDVAIDALLGSRDLGVTSALSLERAPGCFLDAGIARATARFVRATMAAQGLLVPLVAFLDALDRGNLVVFLEKLPPEPSTSFRSVEFAGTIEIGPGSRRAVVRGRRPPFPA